MMKFQIVLYVLIFLMLSSCYNVHKYFYIYKTPLTIKQQKQDIKTNGIYLISESNNDHSPIFMFLYNNGQVLISNSTHIESSELVWSEESSVFQELKEDYNKKSIARDKWGIYRLINDSLIIQYFYNNGTHQTGLMNRNTIDLYGRIGSANNLIISEEKCTWWNKLYNSSRYNVNDSILIYKTPAFYKFYPTDFKPDSSQAWFLKKRWYKKGLHESRKIK